MYIYLTTIIIIIITLCIVFISWISRVIRKELCDIISEQVGIEGLWKAIDLGAKLVSEPDSIAVEPRNSKAEEQYSANKQ